MNRLTRRCSQPLFGVARPCRSLLVYFQLLRTSLPERWLSSVSLGHETRYGI